MKLSALIYYRKNYEIPNLLNNYGYPRKSGQFKIKPFVVILSATHFSHYKILELDLTGL